MNPYVLYTLESQIMTQFYVDKQYLQFKINIFRSNSSCSEFVHFLSYHGVEFDKKVIKRKSALLFLAVLFWNVGMALATRFSVKAVNSVLEASIKV